MTAFIISNLSSNLDRLNKPFNPLQGETFELQRDDYCVVCEQVLTCLSVHCTFENDTFAHLYIHQKITSRLVIGEISSSTHVTSHNWKRPLVLRQSLQMVCTWVETNFIQSYLGYFCIFWQPCQKYIPVYIWRPAMFILFAAFSQFYWRSLSQNFLSAIIPSHGFWLWLHDGREGIWLEVSRCVRMISTAQRLEFFQNKWFVPVFSK